MLDDVPYFSHSGANMLELEMIEKEWQRIAVHMDAIAHFPFLVPSIICSRPFGSS